MHEIILILLVLVVYGLGCHIRYPGDRRAR